MGISVVLAPPSPKFWSGQAWYVSVPGQGRSKHRSKGERGWWKEIEAEAKSGGRAHRSRQVMKHADKRPWHTNSGTQSKHHRHHHHHHMGRQEKAYDRGRAGAGRACRFGGVSCPKWWDEDASELKASCDDAPLRHAHPITLPGRPLATWALEHTSDAGNGQATSGRHCGTRCGQHRAVGQSGSLAVEQQ